MLSSIYLFEAGTRVPFITQEEIHALFGMLKSIDFNYINSTDKPQVSDEMVCQLEFLNVQNKKLSQYYLMEG